MCQKYNTLCTLQSSRIETKRLFKNINTSRNLVQYLFENKMMFTVYLAWIMMVFLMLMEVEATTSTTYSVHLYYGDETCSTLNSIIIDLVNKTSCYEYSGTCFKGYKSATVCTDENPLTFIQKAYGNKTYWYSGPCSPTEWTSARMIDGNCYTFAEKSFRYVLNGDYSITFSEYDQLNCAGQVKITQFDSTFVTGTDNDCEIIGSNYALFINGTRVPPAEKWRSPAWSRYSTMNLALPVFAWIVFPSFLL